MHIQARDSRTRMPIVVDGRRSATSIAAGARSLDRSHTERIRNRFAIVPRCESGRTPRRCPEL